MLMTMPQTHLTFWSGRWRKWKCPFSPKSPAIVGWFIFGQIWRPSQFPRLELWTALSLNINGNIRNENVEQQSVATKTPTNRTGHNSSGSDLKFMDVKIWRPMARPGASASFNFGGAFSHIDSWLWAWALCVEEKSCLGELWLREFHWASSFLKPAQARLDPGSAFM